MYTENQLACMANIKSSFRAAAIKYGIAEISVPIVFSNRLTSTAGKVRYNMHSDGTCIPSKITLSNKLLDQNPNAFIHDTPVHEAAHLIAMTVYGREGIGHGRRWQEVMKLLGHHPSRCHAMQLNTGHLYYCKCPDKAHELSKIRHGKMIRKMVRYRCKFCKVLLQFKNA